VSHYRLSEAQNIEQPKLWANSRSS